MALINAQLPARYKLDTVAKSENRPVFPMQRRSEAENLDFDVRFQPKLPEKRPKPDPRPSSFQESEESLPLSPEQRSLLTVLAEIKTQPQAKAFLLSKPEHEKNSETIDLVTVERKLLDNQYDSSYQFALDMRSIWTNSFQRNANNAQLYSATLELSALFEKLMNSSEVQNSGSKKELNKGTIKKTEPQGQGIKEQNKKIPQKVVNDKPMGYVEKKQLCENIKKIEPKFLKGVLEIVKECTDIKGEELEFDIDKLPPRICRDLEKYINNCLQNTNKAGQIKKVPQVETIRPVIDQVSKINELDNELEKLRSGPGEVYLPENSDVSSESSSTSESEEDIPSSVPQYEAIGSRSENSQSIPFGFGAGQERENTYY
jgi:hypothetical protein